MRAPSFSEEPQGFDNSASPTEPGTHWDFQNPPEELCSSDHVPGPALVREQCCALWSECGDGGKTPLPIPCRSKPALWSSSSCPSLGPSVLVSWERAAHAAGGAQTPGQGRALSGALPQRGSFWAAHSGQGRNVHVLVLCFVHVPGSQLPSASATAGKRDRGTEGRGQSEEGVQLRPSPALPSSDLHGRRALTSGGCCIHSLTFFAFLGLGLSSPPLHKRESSFMSRSGGTQWGQSLSHRGRAVPQDCSFVMF